MPRLYFLLILLVVLGCVNQTRTVRFYEYNVKGKISRDTLFDGPIKFYDTTTNLLVMERNYQKGKLQGRALNYYKNGNVSATCNYENDNINGELKLFDSAGILTKSQYYYHGIRMGSTNIYEKSKPVKYIFFSLEAKPLVEINYDEVKSKTITNLISSFFFFRVDEFSKANTSPIEAQGNELFIYTPNPPIFNFRYSLVLTDSANKITKVLKDFKSDQPWSKTLLEGATSSEKYTIRLIVNDPLSGDDIIMYKYLDQ